jgi:hypothetical protein
VGVAGAGGWSVPADQELPVAGLIAGGVVTGLSTWRVVSGLGTGVGSAFTDR